MYTIPCVSFHSKNTHKRGIISNHFIYSYIYIHGYIHHQKCKYNFNKMCTSIVIAPYL